MMTSDTDNEKEQDFQERLALCINKPDDECTPEERGLKTLERIRCKSSFLYFLRHVKIVEVPKPGQTSSGVIPLELWEHIKAVIAAFLTKPLVSILKARQIGLSTITASYVLWYATTHEGANILLFSKGQPEAKELLAKTRRIYNQLPVFLRLRLEPDSLEEIGFPTMSSNIRAFPSTTSAGISYTASIVVCDEHAEHPYADENYLSSKPTRDAGGQFISIFTANKLEPENLATAIFRDALEKKNDFFPLFFPWYSVPQRDKEWYEATKKNIPERELAKLSPDLYMEQNYPASIDEALRATKTISAFDSKVLDDMMEDTRNPLRIEEEDVDPKMVNIYKPFLAGNFYIAGSDVSHGVGKDFAVTTIMNVKTGEVVADIFSSALSPEELALHSVRLLKLYQNPIWFIEDNEWGRVVISTAQSLKYKRFGYSDKKKTKIGWHTDEKTRIDLWGSLIPAINNHQITIYNAAGLRQFYNVIRNIKKNGRIEASGGSHDDYPIAVGICWCKRGEVHSSFGEVEAVETLTFKRSSDERFKALIRRY